MKILITGGCGFIGSHLAERLIKEENDVTVIDNLSTGSYIPPCLFIKGDIRTYSFERKYDVIFHVAAKSSIPDSFADPLDSHDNNVNGMLRVLEFVKGTNTPIIYSGSSSVYDDTGELNPVSPYALQKLIGEQYLKLYNRIYGLKSVILRYYSVYGERQPNYNSYQTVLSIFSKQRKEGTPFTITSSGEQKRDFIYVKDVVEANIKAMKFVKGFDIFDIGTGVNYSINEVADMIDRNHPREFIVPRIEPFVTLCDYSEAKNKLGWEPKMKLPIWLQSQA